MDPVIEALEPGVTVPGLDQLIARSTDATIGHEPSALAALVGAYRMRGDLLVARDASGDAVGALPLVRVRGPFGSTDASVAYLDGGGPIGAPDVRRSLVRAAAARALARGAALEIRASAPVEDGCPDDALVTVSHTKELMVRDLPANEDEIAKKLDGKTRNHLRKALREGLWAETTLATREAVRAFHSVYARTLRDLGSPSHGLGFFYKLARALRGRVHVALVRNHREDVLAGAFVIDDGHGGCVLPWAASDRRADVLEPNTLLYYEMLTNAVRRGRTRFNFGRSTREAPTYRYKVKWGAEPRPIHWTTFTARDVRKAVGGADRKGGFKLATEVWKKLPVSLAKRAGPILCRWIAA
jgi:hypothetical protein